MEKIPQKDEKSTEDKISSFSDLLKIAGYHEGVAESITHKQQILDFYNGISSRIRENADHKRIAQDCIQKLDSILEASGLADSKKFLLLLDGLSKYGSGHFARFYHNYILENKLPKYKQLIRNSQEEVDESQEKYRRGCAESAKIFLEIIGEVNSTNSSTLSLEEVPPKYNILKKISILLKDLKLTPAYNE